MRRRLSIAAVAGLLMTIVSTIPVVAGGWATLLPDAEPPSVEGASTVIGFTLMQHGVTPVDFGTATIIATNDQDGAVMRAQASPDIGSKGHWTARLSLPAGTWSYVVTHTDLEIQAPGSLTVVSVGPSANGSAAQTATNVPLAAVLIGTLAMLILLAVGVLLFYRRTASEAITSG